MIQPVGLAFLLGTALLVSCSGETTDKQPNVVIILLDDAGYIDFGFMGSEEMSTPHIDQLAAEGVVFRDAHTSASVCSPSRAGLLTGRYQQRFGHEHNSPPTGMGMDAEEITLATAMKEFGYRTALFGKWHVGNEDFNHPNNRGFDHFYGFIAGSRSYFPDQQGAPRNDNSMQLNGKYVDFEGYLTDDLTEKAMDYIGENKDQPFLLFMSYTAVHTPMEATEKDLARFKGHPRQVLAAMTWAVDRGVGNLLAKLEQEGVKENTLIFFLSDNGGPTYSNTADNGPLKSVKGLEFEGGHRVPFVYSWPRRFEGGRDYNGLTSSLDIYATVLAAAASGQSPPDRLDGVDLTPFMTGNPDGEPHQALFWKFHPWAASRVGDYKTIMAGESGSALYDLENDLSERRDLKDTDPETYKKVTDAYEVWQRGLAAPKWYGEGPWEEVKAHMYEAHLNNRTPEYYNPDQMNQWKEKNETQE